MADRRVRKVGRLRFVRLTTGERISQCGRFAIRNPACSGSRFWRVWYRDPVQLRGGPPAWTFNLYETSRLEYALDACSIFDAAVRRLAQRPSSTRLDDGLQARQRKRVGMEAIAAAEDGPHYRLGVARAGELGPAVDPRQTKGPAA